ncbi:MAG: triphosphoribosyl-dephospho-CoA synthase [Candidatus Accumulibacter sp.]|jgi:triphosphoribosyl-dephospho-CoA synthase|nr:triphosphoribosyl-dephospho-CoA synthase [Accumulibacter sp.]
MNSSRHFELERLAAALAAGAMMELRLTPKPGLVDLIDNGSHPDLSLPLMERSIGIVAVYLEEIVVSLGAREPFARQQEIAVRAERQLSAQLGTNTHKGYIFLSGMLLIARHHAGASDEGSVRSALSAVSRAFFAAAPERDTHGERARRTFHTGGIVREALDAYPSLFEGALPVFRRVMRQCACVNTASFAMMATLMQTIDDTTTLHRGGIDGLERVRRDGRALERIIAEGGDCAAFLGRLNDDYKRLGLTIGGVADMLGIAFACLIFGNEIAPAAHSAERVFPVPSPLAC